MIDQALARRALRGALEVRKKAQVSLSDPLCIYDLAERLKVEVRFQAGASFGGMYAKETQTILVPSERPAGRRAYTCAHELGHWHYKHGTKIEDLEELEKGGSDDPDERLVNQFAGHLLMSKWAIERAFKDRNVDPGTARDREIYAIACQFGVGYQTIVKHLRYALGLINPQRMEQLLRSTPKAIRQDLLNDTFSNHVVLVDPQWRQVAIDLEVGDGACLAFKAQAENDRLLAQGCNGSSVFVALRPGITKLEAVGSPWAAFVRISRKGFTGRSIYRHLEDTDD